MKIYTNYYYANTVTTPKNEEKPSFKRQMAEHMSWGANYIKASKHANFKLFTFPDAKKVFVEVGTKAGNSFGKLWERLFPIATAITALQTAKIIKSDDQKSVIAEMNNKGDGVFEAKNIPAEAEAEYSFVIQKADDSIVRVKDPYSKKQDDVNGWSKIYDQTKYVWQNKDWSENDNRRITRKPLEKLRGLENLRIEEINIPTLSQEGVFDTAKSYIDKIAEKGIANTIEIMPVENTNSLQWGYDGVDKFAVNSNMGGPDKLKELVDYAHGKGLNVIMDIVPNHIGPDGDYLSKTGPYEKCPNNWGMIPNYEGENNQYIRDWMTNEALWYIREFNVDGLRLDMTGHCESDWLLKQINEEVHYHFPDVYLFAEEGRENDDNGNVAYRITKQENPWGTHHDMLNYIDSSVKNNISTPKDRISIPSSMEFDSRWDFKMMHAIKDLLIAPDHISLWDLENAIKNAPFNLKFVMSHDEIGNNDGTRLIPKAVSEYLNLAEKMRDDSNKGQRAAHLAQKLCELCMTDDIYNLEKSGMLDMLAKSEGMKSYEHIEARHLEDAFKAALAKQKLAMGTIMTIPGPKMFFQGDDELDLSYFKFFRKFSCDNTIAQEGPYILTNADKGYNTLESCARPQSVLGSVKPANKTVSEQMINYNKDLVSLAENNDALLKGDITGTYVDEANKVHIHQLKYNDNEILVIKNYKSTGNCFHNDYGYPNFPPGQWREIFNSDNYKYGGSGNYLNSDRYAIDYYNQHIKLSPNSVVILKKN